MAKFSDLYSASQAADASKATALAAAAAANQQLADATSAAAAADKAEASALQVVGPVVVSNGTGLTILESHDGLTVVSRPANTPDVEIPAPVTSPTPPAEPAPPADPGTPPAAG